MFESESQLHADATQESDDLRNGVTKKNSTTHTTGGRNRGLWIHMEALLGRYRTRYLDRSQGPPVYPDHEVSFIS